MSPSAPPSIETIARSNEKLLKALITLLSLKDEHLLDELKVIFTLAARQGSEIGAADAKVWAEINRELKVIDAMVSDGGDDTTDGDGELDGEEDGAAAKGLQ